MFGLFKKKLQPDETQARAAEPVDNSDPFEKLTDEQINAFINELKAHTERSYVEITLSDDPVGITDSKLGGVPYIPHDASVPADNKGRQLHLVGQIRLCELPEGSPLSCLSPNGMLQFWALDDDTTGLDFDDGYIANNLNRVVYYEIVDESVTAEECAAKYEPWCDGNSCFPIDGEVKMNFAAAKDGISANDYAYDDVVTELWNKKFPDLKINNTLDLPDEIGEKLYDSLGGFGHKIGGYPGFTQEDPRSAEGELSGYDIILLQIDSTGTDKHEIMWGDAGIAAFFIRREDLERGDFSKVLYTWDCY